MVYKVVSSQLYPFRRENAKFFSQELIEYILCAYGHIWKPKRSTREERLRAVAGYVFTTGIGRLVLFVSQKYGEFVVVKCLNQWKFIMSQRPSVRERSLCNVIGRFCITSELEEDDLGLFTFMAMMAEYARLAITSQQEEMVEIIIDTLTFCLTEKINGGFIATLDRMIRVADSFEYPRSYVTCDQDPERLLSPMNVLSYHTSKTHVESSLSFDTQNSTSVEEVEAEFKKREFRKEYFRRKNMINCATQTEIQKEYDVCHVQSMAMKADIVDYVIKVDIKTDETLDLVINGELKIVERSDVYIQTGSIIEEKSTCPSLASDETGDSIATDTNVCHRGPVDSNALAERLLDIENSQTAKNEYLKETSAEKTGSKAHSSEDVTNKGNSERGETCINPMVMPNPAISKENVLTTGDLYQKSEADEQDHSEIAYLECQIQSIKLKLDSSKADEGINVSFFDSQSVSLNESSCTLEEEKNFEQDESFDSQIESLNASICKSSDESHFEK